MKGTVIIKNHNAWIQKIEPTKINIRIQKERYMKVLFMF